MELNNQKYEKQMISIDMAIFSVIENKLNVLLVKRNQEPFKDSWTLLGGGVYNNESCEQAVARELNEKLNLKGSFDLFLSGVFSKPERDPRFRNISVSYFTLVQKEDIQINVNKEKISQVEWMDVNASFDLGFDHKDILKSSIKHFREKIYEIDIIKKILPDKFTMNDLQKIYESILNEKLDKRNWRRKINSLDFLVSTGEKNLADSNKKSLFYKLK